MTLAAHLGTALEAGKGHERIPRDCLVAHATALEETIKSSDAILVQRVMRETLRSHPATAPLGPASMKYSSSLADALEYALGKPFIASLQARIAAATPIVAATAKKHETAVRTRITPQKRVFDADLDALSALLIKAELDFTTGLTALSFPIPDRFRLAAAADHGFDPRVRAIGFLPDIYRRTKLVPQKSAYTTGLAALNALVDAVLAIAPDAFEDAAKEHVCLRRPAPLTTGATPATAKPTPVTTPAAVPKTDELRLIGRRIFDHSAPPKDLLRVVTAGPAPQARAIISLKGPALFRSDLLRVCQAALDDGDFLKKDPRANIRWTLRFFAERNPEPVFLALYQKAQGDADQKARQIGFFLAIMGMDALRPWATPESLASTFSDMLGRVQMADKA